MNTPARPWLLPLLWTGFGACVVALAASFLLPVSAWLGEDTAAAGEGGHGLVQVVPLPDAAPAAASFDPASDWRQHPDLALLANGDAALLSDLAFQAWHAAQIAMPPAADPVSTPSGQADDLRHRVAAWDALAPAERSTRREQWQSWQRLPASEQAAVRDAAATFAALPPERQQELRRQFDQLGLEERRGWLLGPRLGNVWPKLQPLLMQVPASQREPLLQVLHQCSARQLEDLAILAQRTPPQSRATLRSQLLATTVADRTAWLRGRLRE